jgi:competence protein ComEC
MGGCWIAAVWAFVRARVLEVVACVAAGSFAAGVSLGMIAFANVVDAPLRRAATDMLRLPLPRQEPLTVVGRLVQDAAPASFGATFLLDVTAVQAGRITLPSGGRLRVAVGGDLAAAEYGEWRTGRTLRVPVSIRPPQRFRNPGVPDQERALSLRGVTMLASAKSARLVEVIAPGTWREEAASSARAWVRKRTAAALGPQDARCAAILTAILIGDRAGLDAEIEARLQRAGTFHVIAISGGNIAVLVALCLVMFRTAGVPPDGAALLATLVLGLYLAIAESGPSVARATAMAAAWLMARTADHRADAVALLVAAALVIAALTPLAVFDAGFVLTFGATLAILVGARPLSRWLCGMSDGEPARVPRGRLRPMLAGVAAATICAELAVLPVSARVFSLVTVAGLALNFVAIPAMACAQVAGLGMLLASAVSDHVARACARLAHLGVEALVESARLVDVTPGVAQRVPPPTLTVVCVYYASCLGWLLLSRRRLCRTIAGFGTVASGAWIWMGLSLPAARPLMPEAWPAWPDTLRATFLDVGQGDATLVQFPGGDSMLIDAGGLAGSTFDIGTHIVVPATWALGTRRLSHFVLTHGDPDHVGGASVVLDDLRPATVWEGIAVAGHLPTERLRATAARGGIAWREVRQGDETAIGGVRVRVLSPAPPDWERRRVRNDDSVVLELRYGRSSIVLAGDAGRDVERQLLATFEPAAVRVLKAGHHGSAGSTSREWLDALRPRAIVVSAGRGNRFGHPASAVLDRARAVNARVFRTDTDGAIHLVSDGRRVMVSRWAAGDWQEGARFQ